MDNVFALIEKLSRQHSLTVEEYEQLIEQRTEKAAARLAELALAEKEKHYGKAVFIRGLVEISNICKNDCLYCGIRRSNRSCDRYRLTSEEILQCCDEGYALGFRTFVMQGGEDSHFTDELLCPLIESIKRAHPDCAVTLSLGERSRESYQRLFDAGADRYLLRHETADKAHYEKLHPEEMSYDRRMECLKALKDIGFQTGCGFMVGSPFQTSRNLAQDLKFVEEFKPHMCGIGPFIPHEATPFKDCPAGTAELTCYLLSIVRLICPEILLPATTALGTILEGGREKGIRSGANVVMPNLSPISVRKKYELYNNKLSTGGESAQAIEKLKEQMASVGAEIVTARGDHKEKEKGHF
ncbi:MAG: [FeFe] hydrogenase H-cluster radical SAM maturase HydE [Ruminococcaceae bacterium]|nr:[FeFe] hydrogenase H-cluster radical SAM maturase HydE [Oscillospiraceae bacterium]